MPALDDLEATIASAPSALVAFSGGVDSSLVAAAAARVLGERALAVTAVSPALATGELDGARAVAAAVGIAHRAISTDELAREGYRRNAADRCYHCKSELYDRLAVLAHSEGFAVTFSGANVDDLGDWRPGLRAAAEHGVRHPLVEAGFRKRDVRNTASGQRSTPRRSRRSIVPRRRSRRSAIAICACAISAASARSSSPTTTSPAHIRATTPEGRSSMRSSPPDTWTRRSTTSRCDPARSPASAASRSPSRSAIRGCGPVSRAPWASGTPVRSAR